MHKTKKVCSNHKNAPYSNCVRKYSVQQVKFGYNNDLVKTGGSSLVSKGSRISQNHLSFNQVNPSIEF